MTAPREPEILPPAPRLRAGTHLFRDENLDLLSRVLDTWFRIPGTSIRFGIDGILGLVPGIGDILAGLASCIILFAAWIRGTPYVTLARMLANVAIEVVVGAIPFLGDAFDIAWRANRRNYALLERHIQQPHRHRWSDWLFLLALAMLVAAILVLPLLGIAWLLHLALGTDLHLGRLRAAP
jgi:Domain of unknown function (DUF4112)